jgi:hypothetical protein
MVSQLVREGRGYSASDILRAGPQRRRVLTAQFIEAELSGDADGKLLIGEGVDPGDIFEEGGPGPEARSEGGE